MIRGRGRNGRRTANSTTTATTMERRTLTLKTSQTPGAIMKTGSAVSTTRTTRIIQGLMDLKITETPVLPWIRRDNTTNQEREALQAGSRYATIAAAPITDERTAHINRTDTQGVSKPQRVIMTKQQARWARCEALIRQAREDIVVTKETDHRRVRSHLHRARMHEVTKIRESLQNQPMRGLSDLVCWSICRMCGALSKGQFCDCPESRLERQQEDQTEWQQPSSTRYRRGRPSYREGTKPPHRPYSRAHYQPCPRRGE